MIARCASQARDDLELMQVDSDTYSRIKDIFRGAMALPESKRSTYLDLACDANTKLRREVESLLNSAAEPDSAQVSVRFNETSLALDPDQVSTERAVPKGAETQKAATPDPVGIVGAILDERYRVEHLVDEGGFGYVYRAEHILWRKSVAIKLFKSIAGVKHEALKEAFVKEGALLNDLSRKTNSIVQSYDIGSWRAPSGEALLFTVLEWLDGKTLQAALEEERRLGGAWGWPVQRVIATLSPIAEALEVAHQSGIAHRDIKPSNIFLAQSPGGGGLTPKLLDFGVAKVAGDRTRGFETTGQGIAACSIGYAAPEQLSRSFGPTGPWTDVYGLALVAVELLCGRPTVASGEISEVVAATTNSKTRPTPKQFGAQLPDAIEAVFERALAVKPVDRYQHAGEFWSALRAVISADSLGYPGQTAPSPRYSSFDGNADTAQASVNALSAPAVSGTAGKVKAPPAWRRRMALPAAMAFGALALWAIEKAWPLERHGDAAPAISGTDLTPGAVGTSSASRRGGVDDERLASFAPLPRSAPSPANPETPAKTALGRRLFWDPILSKAGDVSCATCHDLANYGVDGLKVSEGHAGQMGNRNSPSVFNRGQAFALMWDGAFSNLEEQVKGPLLNPVEMAMTEAELLSRLRSHEGYASAFAEAYPGEADPVTMTNLSAAIGVFERQLITHDSKWDRFLNGDETALSAKEQAGFNAFVETGCVTCHFGPNVGDTMFQKLGLVKAWPDSRDRGRFDVTKRDADWMVFRVPSLRNVDQTAPYLHDGSEISLAKVVRLMGRHQLGKELSDDKVAAIVAWLHTLTGELPAGLIEKPEPFGADAQ